MIDNDRCHAVCRADAWQAIAKAYRGIIEDAAKVPLARVMRDRGFGGIAIGIDLDAIELRYMAVS